MFCGDNLISNNFNKVSLVKSLFNQNARLNVLEHYQTLSKIFSLGCFGIAATKIWKTARNVVELSFIKTTLQILTTELTTKEKMFKNNPLYNCEFFYNATKGLQPRNSNFDFNNSFRGVL